MKYCEGCGTEMEDDASFCPQCGQQTTENSTIATKQKTQQNDALGVVALVFMIIGTVCMAFALIPLIWCIPMTIYLNNKLKSGEPIGVGFKVCTLLFVSLIAGILLLCRPEKQA